MRFVFRRPALLIAFFLKALLLTGQEGETDLLLEKAQSFAAKAAYDSVIHTCNKVLALAAKTRDQKAGAVAYNLMSEVMMTNGRARDVARYDSILLPMVLQLNDTSLLIDIKNREGVCLMEKGRTTEAADIFLKLLNMRLEKDQSAKTAEVYSNLASLFMAISKYDQTTEWFFKALRLYEKHNDERGQGETYSNIASVYYLMGRVDDAIAFQKKSIFFRERQQDLQGLVIPHINIGQLYILKDSFVLAKQHLELAVRYAERINNARLRAGAYSGMSTYHIKMKEFGPALQWQNKSIALFEETDNKQMLSRMYVSAGNLAGATLDSAGAIAYYQKALGLSLALGNKENIANAYEKMSGFYSGRQDFEKAHTYYKNYVAYKDTIAMASTMSRIEKVKIEYETEKKDRAILQLASDQRIKQLLIEKQQALLAGNRLEAAQKQKEIELLSQSRELQELKIRQQDEQLEKQFLLAKTNEQQLQLAVKEKELQQKQLKNSNDIRNFLLIGVALLAVLGYFLFNRYQLTRKIREQQALLKVRENIAKDLHDEIGSTLTSIRILSEVSGRNLAKDQDKTSSFIQKITEQSAAAQQGISDIVWAVKPDNDRLENMVIRMREYVAQTLESKNIHTVINIDEQLLSRTLDMNQRRDFLLIFKEAVNNVAKYSEASEVQVNLKKYNGDLCLQVLDNGKGFDAEMKTSSSGLKNMKTRAGLLKGRLDIHSAPEKGTDVSLYIPAT